MDDPQNRAWECLVQNTGPTSTGQTFAQYRAANPTHWRLSGGTGLYADWPSGRATYRTHLTNNIIDGLVSRDVAAPQSWATRTANIMTSMYGRSTNLTTSELAAIGDSDESPG